MKFSNIIAFFTMAEDLLSFINGISYMIFLYNWQLSQRREVMVLGPGQVTPDFDEWHPLPSSFTSGV